MTNNENTEENSTPAVEPIISGDHSSEAEAEEKAQEERDTREESRFKEGQILRFVRVRFPGNSRSFSFLIGKRQIDYGMKVVAMSDRGMAVGYVNSFPYDLPFNKSMLPIRSISKVASDEDIVKDQASYRQQKDAENICNDLIEQHKLDMHLTHVEFTSFGKKAVFYFIAPSRVDFRDLVRDLVGKLKTRIELRQISVRDRSASVGGLGPCGRELCCSSFLTKYGNVGIKMAKNQDLTLNFSKLNGVCGQLKCCLQYEDDVYREKRAHLPKEGDIITTHNGDTGKVLRLHLLSEQFDILTTRGVKKRFVVDLFKDTLNKEEANFPKEFDSISDETHKVVGMEESEVKKVRAFEEEIKGYKENSKHFANDVFENLFGEKSLNLMMPELEEPEDVVRQRKILRPEEEEEIAYTPSEDEILVDDEDDALEDVTPIRTKAFDRDDRHQGQQNRGRDDRPNQQNRGPRDNRPRNEGPRNDNRNNNQQRQGQGQGGRPQGPNQNQSRRPDTRRPDNRGPQGPRQPQNNQNNNQGRNRPPK